MPHSVENHLRLRVAEYDRLIRTFIPGYELMLGTIVRWLELVLPPDGLVIDLGGGTGSLSYLVAEKLPHTNIEIWDVDMKMLALAKERLSKFADRMVYNEKSFDQPLPRCSAVVASLTFHHVRQLKQKIEIYKNIFDALTPGGMFLNGDVTLAADLPLQEGTRALWREFMKRNGMSDEVVMQHFREWAEEDTYFSLKEEYTALAAAGFANPECFWKYGPTTVFGAMKSTEM